MASEQRHWSGIYEVRLMREVETGEQVGGEGQITAGLMREVEKDEQIGGAVR